MSPYDELDCYFTVGGVKPQHGDPSFEDLEDAGFCVAREWMNNGDRLFVRKHARHPRFDGFMVLWRLAFPSWNCAVPSGYPDPTWKELKTLADAIEIKEVA